MEGREREREEGEGWEREGERERERERERWRGRERGRRGMGERGRKRERKRERLSNIPLDDYRIFCGDLGNDVSDDTLAKAFSKYPTFLKAKVIRDKFSKKTKGFGFVSFRDAHDFMQAMREMNGKYSCRV